MLGASHTLSLNASHKPARQTELQFAEEAEESQ